MDNKLVLKWKPDEVVDWLNEKQFHEFASLFREHKIDGKALLLISENDLKTSLHIAALGDVKRLYLAIKQLKNDSHLSVLEEGYDPRTLLNVKEVTATGLLNSEDDLQPENDQQEALRSEPWKTLIALAYLCVVTWMTSFAMVIVHERVPDAKRYPPLPDIVLDNLPFIPWAFIVCEWTIAFLAFIWICILIAHKYRFILLRRFFSLSGTVYLLRCIAMLITSLSVPGTHLDCKPRYNVSDGENLADLFPKIKAAFEIWKSAGLSIQGVKTCGDYMFSGHTAVLTLLNFFITEYTPRDFHLLHAFTWLLNIFGIFFILSGHEHYSVDVFIAFYITSRLFLYYHTLANNQSLMHRDTQRTRVWFPLFSFFESKVDGIVPNVYESPGTVIESTFHAAIQALKQTAVGIYTLVSVTRPEPVQMSPPSTSTNS